jgi:sugar lactone lactonase YvrE
LFRLGTDGQLTVVDTGYTVANGPAINADSTKMLHTDSGRRTIYAFDMDAPKGQLSNKRVWKVFTEAEGYPDGMCFDAEGCVWVAHWGGSCVSRFALDGTLLKRVSLPTSNVTNVCFGGEGLDRLFVSTARAGLTPEQLQAQPEAGCLFEIENPGVKGLPSLAYGA